MQMPDWNAMFVPKASLLEIFICGSIMYLGLVTIFRTVLNRQAGNVGVPDVLLIVLLGDAVQNGMSRDYRSVTEGLLLVLTLVFWDFVLDWLTFRFPVIRQWIHPKPLLLVRDGKVMHANLRQELLTPDELLAHLRQQGVSHPNEVKEARLEGNGQISVIPQEKTS